MYNFRLLVFQSHSQSIVKISGAFFFMPVFLTNFSSLKYSSTSQFSTYIFHEACFSLHSAPTLGKFAARNEQIISSHLRKVIRPITLDNNSQTRTNSVHLLSQILPSWPPSCFAHTWLGLNSETALSRDSSCSQKKKIQFISFPVNNLDSCIFLRH